MMTIAEKLRRIALVESKIFYDTQIKKHLLEWNALEPEPVEQSRIANGNHGARLYPPLIAEPKQRKFGIW